MGDVQRHAKAEVYRATGMRYDALIRHVKDMPSDAAQDLVRMIRDLQAEKNREKQKRRRGQFWG